MGPTHTVKKGPQKNVNWFNFCVEVARKKYHLNLFAV